jgi:hypothetical protein
MEVISTMTPPMVIQGIEVSEYRYLDEPRIRYLVYI